MARMTGDTRLRAAAGARLAGFIRRIGRPAAAAPRRGCLLRATATLALCAALAEPATAQVSTGWLGGRDLKIRLVETETRDTPDGPKVVATVSVENKGDAPLELWRTAGLDVHNDETNRSMALAKLHPVRLERLSQDVVIPAGSVVTFAVVLPEPTQEYPEAGLRLFAPDVRNPVVAEWMLAELRYEALRKLSGLDLKPFATRYRTNFGTLLTFTERDGHLYGQTQTVGARADYGPRINLSALSEAKFVGQMMNVADGRSMGELEVGAKSNTPLVGHFVRGALAHRSFVACPVAADDVGPWADPKLRPGAYVWARTERVEAKRQADGKVLLEADMQLWNVSPTDQNFQLWIGKGPDRMQTLQHNTGLQASTKAYKLRPCETARTTFRMELPRVEVDNVAFEAGLPDQPWARWSISEALAKAGAGAAPGGGYTGGGTGGAGPSRPTTELPQAPTVPTSVREYANYGIWDFRVEELKPGPDGHWQAVVRVRDAATYRVGLTGGGVVLTLFDEDGRSLQSDGRIYRASVAGSGPQLEIVPQTLWMEKGDEVRVRLRIPESQGFKPVRLRLSSGDRETLSRTWAMN